jgi:hypothetical protein
MAFKKCLDQQSEPDSSSLADPADFNRYPCDFPVGVKKRYFPDVYPEYAESPSKRSRSEDQNSLYSFSSPLQEKEGESQGVEISNFSLMLFSCFNRETEGKF